MIEVNGTRSAASFLSRSVAPFIVGVALTSAVALLAAAQQKSNGAAKPGTDVELPGKPTSTTPGSDSSFKGPPQDGPGAANVQGGFNNPGGEVDAAALQAAAAQGGIHYHVHYHGAPGQGGYAAPGYAQTQYVNPASVPAGGTASQYMPGYGPGDPGPLGSAAGEEGSTYIGTPGYTGFSDYGASGNYFGGPGNYFGGGGGVFPSGMAMNAAYANSGYVAGFND